MMQIVAQKPFSVRVRVRLHSIARWALTKLQSKQSDLH